MPPYGKEGSLSRSACPARVRGLQLEAPHVQMSVLSLADFLYVVLGTLADVSKQLLLRETESVAQHEVRDRSGMHEAQQLTLTDLEQLSRLLGLEHAIRLTPLMEVLLKRLDQFRQAGQDGKVYSHMMTITCPIVMYIVIH